MNDSFSCHVGLFDKLFIGYIVTVSGLFYWS